MTPNWTSLRFFSRAVSQTRTPMSILGRNSKTHLLPFSVKLHLVPRDGFGVHPLQRALGSLVVSESAVDYPPQTRKSRRVRPRMSDEARAVCRIVGQADWNPCGSSGMLEQAGFRLTPQVVVEVIKVQDPVVALRIFIWAGRQEGYVHDFSSRNSIVQLWGHKPQFESFVEILDRLTEGDFVITPEKCLVLIKGYGWAGLVDEAIRAFEQLQSKGYTLGVVHFNSIFHVLVKAVRLKVVARLYEQMLDAGISPNSITYALRMRGFGWAGQGEEAIKVFREMLKKGFYPDFCTFGVLIDSVCQLDRVEKMYMIVFELLKARPVFDPTYYDTLIERLCKNGYAEKAKNLVDSLKKRGISATASIYSMIVTGFCRLDKVHDAIMIVDEMVRNRLLPDVEASNVVISTLLREGKVSQTFSFIDRMTSKGLTADISTYDVLIDGLCQCGELQKALGIWNTLVKLCAPNVYSSCILVDGLCKRKRLSQAKLVFKKMVEADCVHDILLDSFKILHSSFRNAGRLNEIKDLWPGMKGGVYISSFQNAKFQGMENYSDCEDVSENNAN
eukprot:c25208_g1_i1 orf=8-1684(-)